MKVYSIYRFTNRINNKVYIGYTNNLNTRYLSHKSNHINPKSTSYNYYLYSAMRKYGFHNFDFEVIYQSKDMKHTLSVMEPYFICTHRSYVGYEDCNGYNLTLGGQGTQGKFHTETTKNLISEIVKTQYKTGNRKPTTHTNEWRQSLKDNNAGGKATSIAIYQFDSSGNLLHIYDSASAAAKNLGDIKYKGNILQSTIKTNRLYKGFYWRKQDHIDAVNGYILNLEELLQLSHKSRHIRSTNKTIQKFDMDMQLLEEYTSIEKAVKLNAPMSRETLLAKCMSATSYKGFLWRVKEGYV